MWGSVLQVEASNCIPSPAQHPQHLGSGALSELFYMHCQCRVLPFKQTSPIVRFIYWVAAVAKGLPVVGYLLESLSPEFIEKTLPQKFDEMGEQLMLDMGPLGLQLATRSGSDIAHVLSSSEHFVMAWPGTPPPPQFFLQCGLCRGDTVAKQTHNTQQLAKERQQHPAQPTPRALALTTNPNTPQRRAE